MTHIVMLGPDLSRDGDVVRASWLDDGRDALRSMLDLARGLAARDWHWTAVSPTEPPIIADAELPDGTILQHACIDRGDHEDFARTKATLIAPGGRRTAVQLVTGRGVDVAPAADDPAALVRFVSLAIEALDGEVADRLDTITGARWHLAALKGSDALLAEGRPGAARNRDGMKMEVCGRTPLSPGFLTLRESFRRPMTSSTEIIERLWDGAPDGGAVGTSVNAFDNALEIVMQPAVMDVAIPDPVGRLRREAELRAILGPRA